VDAYSGATISAQGIAEAVRQTIHTGATRHLQLEPTWEEDGWRIGLDEIGMLVLVAIALITSFARNKFSKAMKVALPLAALVFVGFYTNSSVSLGSLSGILMGYIPDPKHFPIWWIMMGGIAIGLIFIGRNIYCDKLCPFSTVQMLLHKISGMDIKIDPKILKNTRRLIMTMIWASLMLIFLSRHPAFGSYEPFSMMFSLEGMGMQWYILPFSILGSLFIRDFWCRLFCPVGLSLNELVRIRRKTVDRFSSGKQKARRDHARRVDIVDAQRARRVRGEKPVAERDSKRQEEKE
jgi:polyferredoxin